LEEWQQEIILILFSWYLGSILPLFHLEDNKIDKAELIAKVLSGEVKKFPESLHRTTRIKMLNVGERYEYSVSLYRARTHPQFTVPDGLYYHNKCHIGVMIQQIFIEITSYITESSFIIRFQRVFWRIIK